MPKRAAAPEPGLFPDEVSAPSDQFEQEARAKGYQFIAGLDEVGRGPLAGPVIAAAVILPEGYTHPDLNDSKKLTAAKRRAVRDHLLATPGVLWAVGEASVEEIDTINILQASLLAMRRAYEKLSRSPDFLLIDGNCGLRGALPERTLVKGDARCRSIAAASIIAKEHRDDLMDALAKIYPQYGLDKHKGYATAVHRAAIKTHGLTPIHRRSFCCD
ncbi:MAG: ribonuclease HII [Verrucomicrobia bacterium Tous-C9LFEB]|nr:MAG: ribonuclease HII [Verrucomicrobia bacterium Tous-C9LFEB]